MPNLITKLFGRLFQATEPINVIPPPKVVDTTNQAEVQEIPFFTTKNNLLEEFYGIPPVISNSNLSAWQGDRPWKYEVPYNGFMLLGDTELDIEEKKEEIDNGYTGRFMTIEHFTQKYPESKFFSGYVNTPSEPDEEELLHDDVDLLKEKEEDTPGTNGTTFKIEFNEDWIKLNKPSISITKTQPDDERTKT